MTRPVIDKPSHMAGLLGSVVVTFILVVEMKAAPHPSTKIDYFVSQNPFYQPAPNAISRIWEKPVDEFW